LVEQLNATVHHHRTFPATHTLTHKLNYLVVESEELEKIDRPFLRFNRFGLHALYEKDYGRGQGFKAWINETLPKGKITLLTLPRVLGYGFNPVSFWFCETEAGLIAVLVEVNNTFGERHCYLCFKENDAPITPQEVLKAKKMFHVSPFMSLEGDYHFQFLITPNKISVKIDLHREAGKIIYTSLSGSRQPLTTRSLLKSFITMPLMTLKVILLIHIHAVVLFFKKVPFFKKPEPPKDLIS
jgi:uncharacterized protein